jgi:hypothetical protein
MFASLSRVFHPSPAVRPSRQGAEEVAEVHRELERDVDFEIRQGRGGWMVARLRKDGLFHSWVDG